MRHEEIDTVQHGVVLDQADQQSHPPGSASRRAQKVPLTARLSDSVPPEVNSTSEGRAPRAWAIASRDSSTTRRPPRPEVCREDAFPTLDIWSVIASIASGSIGVVAAWSR